MVVGLLWRYTQALPGSRLAWVKATDPKCAHRINASHERTVLLCVAFN